MQLESLGSFAVRRMVESQDREIGERFLQKFEKFHKLNARDLRSVKSRALKDGNYLQLEEFCEYETFLGKSYFTRLVALLRAFAGLAENVDNEEWLGVFLNNRRDTEEADRAALAASVVRTQDVQIAREKYELWPLIEELQKKGSTESLWNSEELRTITRNDPLLSYVKYDSRSNYKPGVANTLGVFESSSSARLLFELLASVARLTSTTLANAAGEEEKKEHREE